MKKLLLFLNILILTLLLVACTTKYNVSFYVFDELYSSQKVIKGENVVKPNDPEKSGFNFLYWELDGNEFKFDIYRVNKDLNINAVFEEVFTVTFDSKGGTIINNQAVVSGSLVSRPNDPIKSNYEFDGWYLDGILYDFNSEVISDLNLVAHYKEIYTVIFKIDNDEIAFERRVVAGSQVIKPTNPSKPNQHFVGWFVDGYLYDFSLGVYKNMILKARFEDLYDETLNEQFYNELIAYVSNVSDNSHLIDYIDSYFSNVDLNIDNFNDELESAKLELYNVEYIRVSSLVGNISLIGVRDISYLYPYYLFKTLDATKLSYEYDSSVLNKQYLLEDFKYLYAFNRDGEIVNLNSLTLNQTLVNLVNNGLYVVGDNKLYEISLNSNDGLKPYIINPTAYFDLESDVTMYFNSLEGLVSVTMLDDNNIGYEILNDKIIISGSDLLVKFSEVINERERESFAFAVGIKIGNSTHITIVSIRRI